MDPMTEIALNSFNQMVAFLVAKGISKDELVQAVLDSGK